VHERGLMSTALEVPDEKNVPLLTSEAYLVVTDQDLDEDSSLVRRLWKLFLTDQKCTDSTNDEKSRRRFFGTTGR
jgi:hypothetical protein